MALEQLNSDKPEGCISRGQHREIITVGAAKTLVARDSGALCLLNIAAGSILTLPAPVVGMEFDVAVTVSVTSNAHSIGTDGAATFLGGGIQQMIDTTAVSEGQFGDPTSDVILSMNGTTTGGLIGTTLRFTAISSTVWNVTGLVASSGTLSTPYA